VTANWQPTKNKTMNTDITKYFDAQGLSLNGKVQLEQEEAHHNCHPDPINQAYEQNTTVYVIDNGNDPVAICTKEDDYDNQIYITTSWEITHPDEEDEENTCDWSNWSAFCPQQGYDLEVLLSK
jgi:hypothetical protein